MSGRSFLAEQVRRASAIGHTLDLVELVPDRKYRATCSCGYSSTNRRTKALALGAGIHHCGEVLGQAARDGQPTLSEAPPAPVTRSSEVGVSVRPAV